MLQIWIKCKTNDYLKSEQDSVDECNKDGSELDPYNWRLDSLEGIEIGSSGIPDGSELKPIEGIDNDKIDGSSLGISYGSELGSQKGIEKGNKDGSETGA